MVNAVRIINPEIAQMKSKDLAEAIQAAVLEGSTDAAQVYITLKRFEALRKKVFEGSEGKKVKEVCETEIRKHLEKGKGKYMNASFAETAVHTWYDYEASNHPVLQALYDIRNEVNENIKELEEELRNFESSLDRQRLRLERTQDGGLDFSDKEITKSIIIEEMPRLAWEASGEVVDIKPPVKGQRMGIKITRS